MVPLQGLELFSVLFENIPIASLDNYLTPVFTIYLTRLQKSRPDSNSNPNPNPHQTAVTEVQADLTLVLSLLACAVLPGQSSTCMPC